MFYNHLAGHSELAVTALLRRQIDYDTTIAHAFYHCTGDQFRRRFTGDQCSGNNDIDLFCLFGEQCHLGIDKFLTHYLGVTAFATAIFFKLEFEKFGIHALNLVFNFRSRVKSPHDRTQGLGGTNGGKAGDTSADYHHLGGRNLAGCGDLTGKKSPKFTRSLDHRSITGDIRHRTQGIQFLRPRDARNTIHGQGSCIACGQ